MGFYTKFDSHPVRLDVPTDKAEFAKFAKENPVFVSIDQSRAMPHNITAKGDIANDLSTLLHPKDMPEYLSMQMRLQQVGAPSGLDWDLPLDEAFQTIIPASCQTASEYERFSEHYAKWQLQKVQRSQKKAPFSPSAEPVKKDIVSKDE